MSHKRIHIRIPILGKATLSGKDGVVIQVQTIDISMGGFRTASPARAFATNAFEVNIATSARGHITFSAILIHENEDMAGFKIVDIDESNLHRIYLMINDFQATEEFIHHIEEKNILHEWLIDDKGQQLDVTFEVS